MTIKDCLHYCFLEGKPNRKLFLKPSDLEIAFELFETVSLRFHVDISGYVLLPNQIHLLLTPRRNPEDLSNFMKTFGRLYTGHFSKTYHIAGTVWRSRFSSSVLQKPDVIMPALLYMEYLPQVLNIRDTAHYPWVSYHHHAGLRNDSFMTPCNAYWKLGNTPFERQEAYKALFAKGCSWQFGEELIRLVNRGWPIAQKDFLEEHNVNPNRIAPSGSRGRPIRN
ncbi:MAG: transposase [Burkholderiales bacterium]|nr:transposase [Burkholderiales bacterium]